MDIVLLRIVEFVCLLLNLKKLETTCLVTYKLTKIKFQKPNVQFNVGTIFFLYNCTEGCMQQLTVPIRAN